MVRQFTHKQVSTHNTESDLYVIIRGKVYDATAFAIEHPGGSDLLIDIAGQDATEEYVDIGHSDDADEILETLIVGVLGAEENSTSPEKKTTTSDATQSIITPGNGIQVVLNPDQFQEFELVEKTAISHNVAKYRFKLPTDDSIFGLPTGQHISIGAPLPQPDGSIKEIIRSYTPISDDSQRGFFDLLIKTYPTGNISRFIDSIALGQSIRVRGPKGAFTYTPNMARHFGMIAGGTGITPMLQIIHKIVRGRAENDKTEVDLIYANVSLDDILLKGELDALTKEDPGIRVHYVLNNPPSGWIGGVGFATAEMITKWLPKPASDVKILLCGPPPMVSGMKKITASLGYGSSRPVSRLEDQVFAF
ncbi:unnamed protein product [Clonostachys rhizophaga]|uniref:NADH-cytochrome b5 reductase 1 n=1 Tax=Clonostachys rhizophaga TaxID=160324 RepID=A0A9N9VRY1_9HYPO|nr:unnamed protein product [Clonostachys rhizophaga]